MRWLRENIKEFPHSFSRKEIIREREIVRVKDNKLYLFSFLFLILFYFPFIFAFFN